MFLIIGLTAVVAATFAVTGWIIYSSRVDEQISREDSVVPIADLSSFNKGKAASAVTERDGHRAAEDEPQKPEEIFKAGTSSNAVSIQPASFSPSQEPSAEVPAVSQGPAEPGDKTADEIRTLKEEVRLIREKAVIQAKNAIEVINKLRDQADQLRAENKKLLIDSGELAEKDKLISRLEQEKIALMEDLHINRQEVESLQTDFGQRSASAQQVIDNLQAENSMLKNISRDADQERQKLSQEIRDEFQSRIADLVSQIEALNNEKEARLSVRGAMDPRSRKESSNDDEMASLSKAADVLREDRNKLEAKIREVETRCSIEMERNSFLQYELTKSRAQAVGMEKIYENSRKQIEDLTRQISDARLDNKELKKQADMLGKSLSDFRRLNAELLKREKLSQFEIERNRGDLRDLERIYDGFRSRIERVGMSEDEVAGK